MFENKHVAPAQAGAAGGLAQKGWNKPTATPAFAGVTVPLERKPS